MASRIVVLLAVLSACMACPSSLPATEPASMEPKLVDPGQKLPGAEERLVVIESRIAMLEEKFRIIGERIEHIDRQHDRLYDAVAQLQKDVQKIKGIKLTMVKEEPTPQPRQGKFIIRNWTGVNQYVSVNGLRYFVSPGRTEIMVPHTTVEAYLPGFEGPKLFGMSNWQWTGQNHEMFFDIRI